MKRTMKKALVLISVIVAAMLIMTFAVSAASDCGDGNHIVGSKVIEADCVSGGYTETYCTVCGTVFGTSGHVAALGHDYIDAEIYYEVAANGDGFSKKKDCQRVGCGHIEVEDNTYYSVTFVNPWVTDKVWEDVTYTDLAKEWKDEQVAFMYVLKGDAASDEGIVAKRKKDKAFGKYNLSGWADSKVDSGEFTEATLFDFAATPINKNTTVYAAFTGDPNVSYTVRYLDADGEQLTRDFLVFHGKKADDSIFIPTGTDENGKVIYENAPTMDENYHSYYTFDRWNIDITKIYEDISIKAIYESHDKVFEYVFCNYEGVEVAREEVAYGHASKYFGSAEFEGWMARPKDRTYIYAWLGEMSVTGQNHTTTISTLIPHMSALDTRYKSDEYYKPTYLVPKYSQRLVEYVFNLTCVIPSSEPDIRDYLDAIIVQVVDDNGQLVASGRTSNVNGQAVFKHTLRDSQYYTITAVTEDEKYHAQKTLERAFIYDTTYTAIDTTINLEISQDYLDGLRCHCIHHFTLIRPLWVRILNILYNLFNFKYVCCDDMYATLGDVLAYTK